MADNHTLRTNTILKRIQKQDIPMFKCLNDNLISENVYKHLFEDYYVPKYSTYSNNERYHTTTISSNTIPTIDQSETITNLTQELGFNPIELCKYNDALLDIIPEKVQQLMNLEDQIKTIESRIQKKNNILKQFIHDMEDVDATIDEETKSLFNASIQNALLKEAQEKNIHKLLEDYNNIQLQCKILREPLNIFKRKYDKLNIGQCGIC